MKVVVNTQDHYLKLSRAELELICSLLGWTLKGEGEDAWFYDADGTAPRNTLDERVNRVDWVQFRSHPTLVQLVEQGKLHDGLEIVVIPDGTDYWIHQCYPSEFHDDDFTYCGEYVERCEPTKWYPRALENLYPLAY